MGTIRRQHTPEFKSQVVMELLREEQTISEISSKFSIHPTQAKQWKMKAQEILKSGFRGQTISEQLKQKDKLIDDLYQEIGKLKYQLDWLKKRWDIATAEKVSLIEKDNDKLSIREQCGLFGINRSNYYYEHKPIISQGDKDMMDAIDMIYTKRPFYGVRKITKQLHKDGAIVNHKRVHRLMQILGIEAIYPKPNLSKNTLPHPTYPYLLKNKIITNPNQVWGIDITYIRLKKDWLYLVAILDWHSRYVLSWELSDTMSVGFCCEALQKALTVGIPEIHNSDQGVQFTAEEYLAILKAHPGIRISMDHKGRCFDNIFTERLWRTVKYEEVYLKSYESPREARQCLRDYILFYNNERLHQSLNYMTPAEVYFGKSIN